jgi:hypothetical protein
MGITRSAAVKSSRFVWAKILDRGHKDFRSLKDLGSLALRAMESRPTDRGHKDFRSLKDFGSLALTPMRKKPLTGTSPYAILEL